MAGARRTVPLAVGALPFGLVFGVLAHKYGLSPLEATLMSSLVFAGASQLIAIVMWTVPLPVAAIILTTLVVNLRHLLMGAALRPWLSKLRPSKAFGSVFLMSDETWALTMREFTSGGRDAAFMLGSGVLMFAGWVGGTIVGRLAGSALTEQDLVTWGLDFIFTSVFTALLVSMWKGRSDLLPWATAAVVALAGRAWLPGNWYILLGGLAGSLVGALRNER